MPVIQRYALRFVASIFAIPEERLDVIRRWNQLSTDAPVLELADEGSARAQHLAAKQGVYDLVDEAVADRRERLQRGETPEDLVSLWRRPRGATGSLQPWFSIISSTSSSGRTPPSGGSAMRL